MKRLGIRNKLATWSSVAVMSILLATSGALNGQEEQVSNVPVDSTRSTTATHASDLPTFPNFAPVDESNMIQLCQGCDGGCNGGCGDGACGGAVQVAAIPMLPTNPLYCDGSCGGMCEDNSCRLRSRDTRVASRQVGGAGMIVGVDEHTRSRLGREPGWKDQHFIPWEAFAYGEYIGPHRTPHVGEYRIRVNDQLEFVYLLTREKTMTPYQLYVGDVIQITSAIDATLNQQDVAILSDGTISLSLIGQVHAAGKTIADLQESLNEKYSQYVKNPAIVVQVTESDTPLKDVIQSVDATAGQGGQLRQATVSPDGTVQLPLIGSVPAIGLTLDEVRREVNARYRLHVRGIEVTPVLLERAPRFVFVVGEVAQPGRFELTGPTTAIQALALAEGTNNGGNTNQVIIFRRDQDWRLMATRLNLAGAFYGRRPHPTDDVWLRDSDIVMVPKKPILRLSEAVNLYFSDTLFRLFPAELGSFDAGQVIQ